MSLLSQYANTCKFCVILTLMIAFGIACVAGPSIIGQTPSRGQELQLQAPIEIMFNTPMNRASVQAAWRLQPEIDGSWTWLNDSAVQFLPDAKWARDTAYTLTILGSALSSTGELLAEDYVVSFRTVGYLEVAQVSPPAGASEIAVDSEFFILFDRPVVPLLSLSDRETTSLPQPLILDPAVPGIGEWINTSVYVFSPEAPLKGGTTYTATVPAGLTDTTGGVLADDVVWQFSTERPKIARITPSDRADLVPVDTAIRLTFNMPVSLPSVESRFSLRKSGLLGELLASKISGTWSVDGSTVIFTPDESLQFGQSYVLSLEAGVTGIDGGVGTDDAVRSQFETVPLPRILRTDPKNGESDVYPYTSFVITFNAPIDADTVLDNITISPAPETGEISGYFRSWDNAYVVRFNSGPSQAYEVHIAPGITDPYGNRIGQAITVRFKTRALDPAAWLQVPDQVGTLSTYQPARIFVAHRNSDTLRLKLTRLTLDEYFTAMDDWYRYTPPSEGRIREWTIPVSGDLNAIAFTPVDLSTDGGALNAGIYLLDLEADGVTWNRWQHRHILIASPVNLTMKSTETETLVWACDLSTGAPIPGLILRSYDADGQPVEATVTDSSGLATFAVSESNSWRGVTVAGNGPFTLSNSQWTSGISIWDFGYSSGGSADERLFLDTDRPIYRPGQTVSFRGVLREEQDAHYSLPAAESVDIEIRDVEWNVIYEKTLDLDALGTFSDRFDLADDAGIGTYRIEMSSESAYYSDTFDVAAYRAPEFEVTVSPEHDAVAADQALRILVQTDYFFGAPVVDQAVDWSVFSETYTFSPAALGRYKFSDRDDPWACWSCWWMPAEPPTPILEGSALTNASGQILIEITPDQLLSAEADSIPGSRRLTVEATTRGADGQVISGRSTAIVHAADFYVGLAAAQSVARAGDATEVDVVTVDWTGERVPSQSLDFQILRREWDNVFEEDDAGGGSWTWTVHDVEIQTGSLRTDDQGSGRLSFTPPQGGTYKVLVSGVDAAGRETRSSIFLWASGPGTVSWRRTNDDRITLIPDKSEYEVGEVARILIPSPYSQPHYALLTVERDGILFRDVLQLETNSTVLEIPITVEHIPNIYVSVVLFEGLEAAKASASGAHVAETKVGYAALAVSTDPKTLHIELEPSTTSPLPASEIAYDVRVTDAYGNPARTAVAFDLVDAAVLSLLPRTPNAILDAFYGHRGLGVTTSSGLTLSINRLVQEQLSDYESLAAVDTAVENDAVGGALAPMTMAEEAVRSDGSASDQLPEGVTLREDFQDTAFWNGSVVTDDDGHARLSFQLPDNLTTWIARAVGVTADTEVGETTQKLLVTKPLLVRPVAPRFFVVGDRVRLQANVSNQTDADLTTEVTIAQVGLLLEEPSIQTVVVPAQGEVSVTWWGRVEDIAQVDLAFSATSGNLSDAARPRLTTGPDGTLKVYRYTSPEIVGTAGQLDEAGSVSENIVVPATADLSRSELLVRLETSLAAAMQEGLDYLEHFEYECTEQIISRFLPNVLTYRALQSLGLENPTLAEKLPGLVTEGLEKLYERQNPDGGWGWWNGVESNAYLSAYAVYGLIQAGRADFAVRDQAIADGLDFLERSLVSDSQLTSFVPANRQAWLAYVLSEGDRHKTALRAALSLFENRAKLGHYARAWLALSLSLSGGDQAAIDTLVSDLYAQAIVSATGVHWEEENYDWWAMNTDTRSTAVILDALVRLDADQPLLPNVVRWLMVARSGGIWETTQETAWALISLTDWMLATGEANPTYDLYASLNGREIVEGQTDGSPLDAPIELHIGAESLTPGANNTLTVVRGEGTGRLYYTAHLTSYIPVEQIDELQRGIVVQRQYVPASCALDDACSSLNTVTVGDEIQVRLTLIAPHDLYYVVVEDPFPAGCEAVDPSLATTSLTATDPGLFRDTEDAWSWMSWWWWHWYSRSEFRDEKIVLFADYLPSGTYTFQYTLRAVTPGEFGVLPTLAQEFYFPEVFGRSSGLQLTVEPADT